MFTQQLQKDIVGLEKDQRYEIAVRAFTRVGPGPYSKSVIYSTETGEFYQNVQRPVQNFKLTHNRFRTS